VLLNRPGRSDAAPFGYGDNGLTVSIDDRGTGHDIHTYQVHGIPYGPLMGFWSSDGRAVDPDLVTPESLRTATLAAFADLDPNGTWILFVADLGLGGTARLDSWDLRITTRVIPEPAWMGLLTAAGLGVFGWIRRSREAAN
jgi:hypothetical protein